MSETKRCCTCKKIKTADDFHNDSDKPGGKQSQCKECKLKAVKARAEGKITPRAIIKQRKMMRIARKCADGKDPAEAYFELGTTKNKSVATKAVNNFLKILDDSDTETFRKMITPPKVYNGLRDFFTEVLTRDALVTVDEYIKTALCWGKFAGTFAPESVITSSTTTTAETRVSILEDVSKMLEANDKKEPLSLPAAIKKEEPNA